MSQNDGLETQPSGWAMGWATLAAILLIIGGIWGAIVGIAGIAEDDLPRVIDERGERAAFRFDGSEAGVSVVTRARPRGADNGLALVRYEIVRRRAAGAGSGLALLRHQARLGSSGR